MITQTRPKSVSAYLAAFACIAVAFAAVAITIGIGHGHGAAHTAHATAAAGHTGHTGHTGAAHAAAARAKKVVFEHYRRPSPELPAVPAGKVKRFRVEVYEHVTRVSKDAPPRNVWSFSVNGQFERGTGLSAPMVVNEGDHVAMTFVNGGSKAMRVDQGHSLDIHAADVAPGKAFQTLAPGGSTHFNFVASHPGTFLYHCATEPMIMHLGAGMVGMLVVKPRHMAPVDKELYIMQQEYYPSDTPGGDPSMDAMMNKKPDVVAFNGYADQYKSHPIHVRKGKRIRVYLLDAGPSLPLLFHVLGTVFTKTDIEGQIGHSSQTVMLGPSQGGYVEFSLKHKGAYPFVTHSFADMMKGAMGAFVTPGVPDSDAEGF
jgi:nitrite reductase (NO-forming)